MTKELIVLVNDDILGTVTQGTSGRLSFEYDDEWMDRLDAYPLSLSMPMTAKRHTHAAITNYLLGLLPDREASIQAIAKKHGVSSRNPFALIGAIGEDLAGAVQMVPETRLDSLRQREGAPPISEARLAKFLTDLVANPGETQITNDAGLFSLAGAQPKKAISWVNKKWFEPRGRTPSTHIIKPPMPALQGQVENEHFCLLLAQACGLRAAKSQVVEIGGKPNIISERYDRRRFQGSKELPLTRAGGTVVRLHQEDFCQALGVDPANKYQSETGGPGVKEIMNVLAGSGNANADRNRFMRAIAFNYVVLGTDAHAKNYSILIEAGNYRLAPLYDINSILPYELPDARKLAMNIGKEYRWRMIGPRHFEKMAEACQYPAEQAIEHVRSIAKIAPDAASDLKDKCRQSGLKTPTLTKLSTAIAARSKVLLRSF